MPDVFPMPTPVLEAFREVLRPKVASERYIARTMGFFYPSEFYAVWLNIIGRACNTNDESEKLNKVGECSNQFAMQNRTWMRV